MGQFDLANGTMLVDVIDGAGPRVERAACWRLLHVAAYVREKITKQILLDTDTRI